MPHGEYLIIDGYNVINAWPELIQLKEISFEHARIRLLDILSNYSGYKNIKVIIVFDAHQVKGGLEKKEYYDNIEVIYSQEGITADMVIEKLIDTIPKRKKIFVATSDKVEQDIIWAKGAFRISSRELLIEIKEVLQEGKSHFQEKYYKPFRLDAHLDEDVRSKLEKWRRGK